MRCYRCNVNMGRGLVILSTVVPGEPDFPGDREAVTMSHGGPGVVEPCWKCPKCGHTVLGGVNPVDG